ncbi:MULTISPECIES: hypothetical protein [Carnobacterium]|uniref:hypothetical protein n=1 Tax=Carnobacterium TaxID=2747 RepID=UPI0005545195|nr:hypothetical protein [Carnobacterium maltaromaticum]AOA01458.1 hypothetical protein BFC23_02540 [Carnobacterium maltaromaticum]
MKTFNYTTAREAKISIDESIYNKEWLEEFSKSMYDLDNINDLGKHILKVLLRLGIDTHVEGVGDIKVNGEYPDWATEFSIAKGIEVLVDLDEIEIY